MHTSRHSRKNSSFSTQGEHLVLLGLEALTEASNLRYATRSKYQGFAADRLQHTLLRRFCFQRRLKPGVRPQSILHTFS